MSEGRAGRYWSGILYIFLWKR